jgi:hypothetical protein
MFPTHGDMAFIGHVEQKRDGTGILTGHLYPQPSMHSNSPPPEVYFDRLRLPYNPRSLHAVRHRPRHVQAFTHCKRQLQ